MCAVAVRIVGRIAVRGQCNARNVLIGGNVLTQSMGKQQILSILWGICSRNSADSSDIV